MTINKKNFIGYFFFLEKSYVQSKYYELIISGLRVKETFYEVISLVSVIRIQRLA